VAKTPLNRRDRCVDVLTRRIQHVTLEATEIPAGIELAAYRIIQEALTNAIKHAAGATATVRVCYRADRLELEITDTGTDTATPASGGGHGLVGMRERVALYGGRFDAVRPPGGGFAIRVLLPVR
jgi:signal transduction histidine kinase